MAQALIASHLLPSSDGRPTLVSLPQLGLRAVEQKQQKRVPNYLVHWPRTSGPKNSGTHLERFTSCTENVAVNGVAVVVVVVVVLVVVAPVLVLAFAMLAPHRAPNTR